jgi:hypothetical protein
VVKKLVEYDDTEKKNINEKECKKGNKKVGNGPKNMKMTNGQK